MKRTAVVLLSILIGCFQVVSMLPVLNEDFLEILERELDQILEKRSHHNDSLSSSSSSSSEEEEEDYLGSSTSGFPYIKGPESFTDRIAIVGAGPSGVHMALKLKEAGFSDVTVFEKEEEVGGKSKTLLYRDVVHEMGTCYSQPDYTELYRLLETYNAGDLRPLPSPTVWRGQDKLTSIQNMLAPAAEHLPDASLLEIKDEFMKAIHRYLDVHNDLFGNYEGELMPRPSRYTLKHDLNMTLLEFMTKHNVDILANLFLQIQTIQGYGHLDEIPALYGLTWMTSNFLLNLLKPPEGELSAVKILSKGYQTLWKEIVDQENINVRYSSPVRKIYRRKKENRRKGGKRRAAFEIHYDDRTGFRKGEPFDFLVLTPEMKLLSDLDIIDFNDEEMNLFERMNHHYYATTLVDTTYGTNRGFTPQSFFADNTESKVDGKVWGKRDSYNSLVYNVGKQYTDGLVPGAPDGRFEQTSVYYQFSKSLPEKEDLLEELVDHIRQRENAEVVNILDTNVWDYFPQFSVKDIASGITWDIFDMQGKYGIWYAGSSVYFESVKSVLEYNNLIFRQYRLPESE
ncbi:uncharacterized protein LOC132552013 [Ylistrum balloti]|uniref:uncharacterized protein LOC132552013 n=1 Tax=Ylistrum balloti TaxID=509963 RepID=UPI002905ED3D|nr:uncharacterized protein LOC132552013 [Ylistrum balloti]